MERIYFWPANNTWTQCLGRTELWKLFVYLSNSIDLGNMHACHGTCTDWLYNFFSLCILCVELSWAELGTASRSINAYIYIEYWIYECVNITKELKQKQKNIVHYRQPVAWWVSKANPNNEYNFKVKFCLPSRSYHCGSIWFYNAPYPIRVSFTFFLNLFLWFFCLNEN